MNVLNIPFINISHVCAQGKVDAIAFVACRLRATVAAYFLLFPRVILKYA